MSKSSGGFLLSSHSNQNTLSADGEFLKRRELIESDYFQNQQQQQNCGIARYRSAPSSFLAALLDSNTDNSSSGDESEAFFSALIDGNIDLNQKKNSENQMQYSMKQEVGVEVPEPRPGKMSGSYAVGMENQINVRVSNGNENTNCSNLLRQSTSPAGFFTGFDVVGEAGNYRLDNHAEASSSAGALSSHMNLSSGPSSSSRFMPSIPENGHENSRLRNDNSANDSSFNCLKRNVDGDLKMFSNFNGLENQNGEARKKPPGLVSHLSLPKTSAEMAAVENILQFGQETMIPCQVRAKRGCATHPRSIAERMRRTRISENMKKLQDLFPNMDKQTNTADMLDLAVEYIKDLQNQLQALTDTREKCVCSNKREQTSPTM